MIQFNELSPILRRKNGTSIDDMDTVKLHVFFAQFIRESDSELNRQRNRMLTNRSAAPNAHLNGAKLEILTAIIRDRSRHGR